MTTMPHDRPNPNDDWRPANGDELPRLGQRLKRRQSRRQFMQIGSGIVGGLMAGGGAWLLLRDDTAAPDVEIAGLTCSQVAAMADDLAVGRLTAPQVARVKRHVQLCPDCAANFERIGAMKYLG